MTNPPDAPLVSLVRCASYAPELVLARVREALEPLGGMGAFVKPGDKVLVKPNLLTRARPEKAVTTHPEVVRAVVRLARECGGEVTVGDSPGGVNTAERAKRLFDTSGMARVCAEEGARLVLFDDRVAEGGSQHAKGYKSLPLAAEVLEADVLVDLPKLKTHGLMMMTAAVKNLFGCIPGTEKARFHLKVPDRADFAEMLLDLALACRPALVVMDAVVGMEGDGPSAGDPREIGLLLASTDPIAADIVAAEVLGLHAMDVYTNLAAHRRGLAPRSSHGLRLSGERLADVQLKDFKAPARDPIGKMPPFIARRLRAAFTAKPVALGSCPGCGRCEEACPAGAVVSPKEHGGPSFDYDACIRCYCCQELCPHHKIGLKVPWTARLLGSRG